MSTPIQRRDLLGRAAGAAGAAVAATLVLGFVPLGESRAEWRPRPPGALDGSRFTAACARCGRCVTACPYDTLRLAAPGDPAPIGTPFFTPRDVPCYMCKDIPCVKACPTGALDPLLDDIRNARMGVAAVDPNSCLSWQGLRCEVCLRECPEANRAITIEMHPRGLSKHAVFVPVVHPDACTGCGLCERGCPTEKAAIRVVDHDANLGAIGRHYRLGWLDEDDPKNRRSEAPAAESTPSAGSAPSAEALDYLNGGEDEP